MFRYLNVGLGFILFYVGVKMLLQDTYKIPAWVSLIVIALTLGVSLGYSVYESRRYSEEVEEQAEEDEQARRDDLDADAEAKRSDDDR